MSVRKSLAWSYGAQALIFVATFASSVIVARILGPYEMGIFAVGMSTAGVLSTLAAFGIGPYLVRHETADRTIAATVFTLNAILNAIVCIGILSIVALAPRFGLDDSIRKVLLLLAIAPLIGIAEFLPGTYLQREMRFKAISIIAMLRTLMSCVLLLTLAISGLGYLSPAIALVGSSAFSAVAISIVARDHVSFRVGLAGWRDVLKFGLQMLSIGGLATMVQRLSELILARFLGIAALGVYARASTLANQVWDNVYGLGTRVIFTQMAKEMRETGTVRRTFIHGLAIITALIWPMLLGISVLSRPLIHMLYGERWNAAAVPLSILLVAHFVSLGFGMNWELCVLKKQTGWQARNEGIRAVAGLVAFTIGASFNLAAAAVGRVCESLCGLVLFGPRMREMAGTESGEIVRVYRQSSILTLLAVGPAALLMVAEGWSPETPWWSIGGAIMLGIALWAIGLERMRHPVLDEFVRAASFLRRSVGQVSS